MKNKYKITIAMMAVFGLIALFIFRAGPVFYTYENYKVDEEGNLVFKVQNQSNNTFNYGKFDKSDIYFIEEKINGQWTQKKLNFPPYDITWLRLKPDETIKVVVEKTHIPTKEWRLGIQLINQLELSDLNVKVNKFFNVENIITIYIEPLKLNKK